MGIPLDQSQTAPAPPAGLPPAAEIRAWARDAGIAVSDRGRLRPDVFQAWKDAHEPC
jgi:hypothetical protein